MDKFITKYSDQIQIFNPGTYPIESWINKLESNSLENEKNNYIEFYEIVLHDLLGYNHDDLKWKQYRDEKRPVEFTFVKEGKEYVVIELKGTKTHDLTKRYNVGMSPVEQVTKLCKYQKRN